MKIGPLTPPKATNSTSTTRSQTSQQQQTTTSPAPVGKPEVRVGQFIQGRVFSVDPTGLVGVETPGGRFFAQSVSTLSVGDQILLEVLKMGANPVVGIAPAKVDGPEIGSLLRMILPLLRPGQGLLAGVLEGMQTGSGVPLAESDARLGTFLLENAVGPDPDPLRTLRMAALVASIKSGGPLSTLLQKVLGVKDLSFLEKLSEPELKKIAQLLETHGRFNAKEGRAGAAAQPPDLWLFPCFLANGTGAGEWLFSFESQEVGGEERAYSFAFYLNMSRLGDVHLQLRLGESSLVGVFTLENAEAAQHLRGHLHQLQEALEACVGKQVGLTCRAGALCSIERLKNDLQEKGGLGKFALVDLSV